MPVFGMTGLDTFWAALVYNNVKTTFPMLLPTSRLNRTRNWLAAVAVLIPVGVDGPKLSQSHGNILSLIFPPTQYLCPLTPVRVRLSEELVYVGF